MQLRGLFPIREKPPRVATNTLRIGQFTDSYPPIINGVSSFVDELHRELLAQHRSSFVFTYGHTTDTHPEPGVYRTPGLPMGKLPFHVALTLDNASRRVANTLDVFHIHEPLLIANMALPFAARLDRPAIFTCHTRHDTYTNNYPRAVRPSIRQVVSASMEKAIRGSALATAPSENTARWMRSLVPDIGERVIVMRNGIHLEQFEKTDSPIARDSFGIGADQIVVMYVGRLTPEKNLEAFAEGFMHAVGLGAPVHWVILGEGKMRPILEEMLDPVRERVHFTGAVPRTEIPRYLAMADLFGTASLSEANPVSVIEAMACGKPYIGMQADWWSEFTANQTGGLLAETPQALGAALKRLAEDPVLRADLSAGALRIGEQFDIHSVADRWIEIYQRLVEERQLEVARG